ncbi:MAG: uroporphyrinogen decarboxylase family protein [Thermodesulfobacteriota bacterium]
MNARERFLAIMNFEKADRTLFWEMGYWKDTLERWYSEGLPKGEDVTSGLKPGEGVRAESAPHKIFPPDMPRDTDVHTYFDFDPGLVCLPVNSLLHPPFEKKTLEETEDYVVLQDELGVQKKMNKKEASRPQFLKWPAQDRKGFEELKDRLKPVLRDRIPQNWSERLVELAQRDYPLTLGGYPCGFYGTLRFLMGEENFLLSLYDDPPLVKEFMNTLADFWIELWGQALSEIKVDCVNFWEDMAYRTGPLISPEMFREFMLPPYQKLTSFLRSLGITIFIVDSDGNLEKLIPLFLDSGITALFPFEAQAGNDIVSIRRKYPRLGILGGIDKIKIAQGEKAIDEELNSKIPLMLRSGGYVPHLDHHVHPDISWKDFVYYRTRLKEMILSGGK